MYNVADFIIRIKNASAARRKEVRMPYSNLNKAIAKTLVKQGFLADVKEVEEEGKRLLLAGIRFQSRKPVVTDVQIISKPSLRAHMDVASLAHEQRRDSMTLIVSTSSGIMSGKDAIKKGIGGELLFKIG
jgi:small subunit ribosomal protein S8